MKTYISSEKLHTVTIILREAEREMIVEYLRNCPTTITNHVVVNNGLIKAFELPPEPERP